MPRHKEFEPDAALVRALELFWERGYDSTSMQDLVQRMGIHKRSMYDTFGDKRSLFVKALDRYIARSEAGQLSAVESGEGDARVTIRGLLHESFRTDGRPRGCLAVNTATEPIGSDSDIAVRLDRHFAATLALLTGLIEQGQRDSVIDVTTDAADLAFALHNAWNGLRVQARTGTLDDRQLRDAADRFVDVLL